jgi:electron transport complex, rnfABCDGE type, C subunit
VRACGLMGLGGAGFPTSVKLAGLKSAAIDTLVINGAECEPYLTCDYRIMLEKTDLLLEGAELILRHMPGGRAVIGIENNKPKAIEKIKADAAAKGSKLEVLELKSRYPQGAEKVIVYEATGRVIPEGKLPSDVGVLVMNVGTVIKLAEYVKTGLPLTSRMVTVDGGAVAEPKNVWVPIGTKLEDIINFCGGYKGEPAEIILGGPMMGTSCRDDQTPISKTNNGLLVFNEKEAKMAAETACIRCGRCLRACPLSLSPAALDRAYHAEDVEALKALHVNLCMECGCCAYVCPAKRHLVVYNQLGKQMIKK